MCTPSVPQYLSSVKQPSYQWQWQKTSTPLLEWFVNCAFERTCHQCYSPHHSSYNKQIRTHTHLFTVLHAVQYFSLKQCMRAFFLRKKAFGGVWGCEGEGEEIRLPWPTAYGAVQQYSYGLWRGIGNDRYCGTFHCRSNDRYCWTEGVHIWQFKIHITSSNWNVCSGLLHSPC